MTGHSVGGALASLVGQTFGIPTVTFETPGDRLASQRLHLPHNYQDLPIWHFGHTADPIFTGDCVVSIHPWHNMKKKDYKLAANAHIGLYKQLLVCRLCYGIKMSYRKGKHKETTKLSKQRNICLYLSSRCAYGIQSKIMDGMSISIRIE